MRNHSVFRHVHEERAQGHGTRRALFKRLEHIVGRPVVTFFTSFHQTVSITDSDSDILEGVLQDMDLKNGLMLIIDSPGGHPLAAERIIRACRTYSGTGRFIACVAGAAKSAATMICMGAERIVMGPTSELGPVDPQVVTTRGTTRRAFSVFNVVRSYEMLFREAARARGNLQPYLQQLARYDPMEVEELRSAIELSVDISVKALASGMMASLREGDIKKRITPFLEPHIKKVHGRPIFYEEARECGLDIEPWNRSSPGWRVLNELHLRTKGLLVDTAAKVVENGRDCHLTMARS